MGVTNGDESVYKIRSRRKLGDRSTW